MSSIHPTPTNNTERNSAACSDQRFVPALEYRSLQDVPDMLREQLR